MTFKSHAKYLNIFFGRVPSEQSFAVDNTWTSHLAMVIGEKSLMHNKYCIKFTQF